MIYIRDSVLYVNAKWLIVLFFVLGIVTFALAYWVSLKRNFISYPSLFLSLSINYQPASCIGSFFLSPGGFILLFLALCRYVQIEQVAPKSWLNRISFFMGILAGIGAHAVGSIQVAANFYLHMIAAGIFFASSAIFLALNTAIDIIYPSEVALITRRFRAVFSALMFLSALGLAIIVGIASKDEHYAAGSFLEMAAYIFFLLAFLTFGLELEDHRIAISLVKASTVERKTKENNETLQESDHDTQSSQENEPPLINHEKSKEKCESDHSNAISKA